MQVCLMCNVEKSLEEYGPAKSKESVSFNANVVPELKKYCRPCLAHQAREWRKSHKGYNGTGKFASLSKDERKLVSAISTRLIQAKRNNKRTGRPFNLTSEHLLALWKQQNGKCIYTGQVLLIGKSCPSSLSIDKIIPELGYVEGNVQWVAWAVNRAKGDMDEQTFIRMCSAVAKGATTIP